MQLETILHEMKGQNLLPGKNKEYFDMLCNENFTESAKP